MKTFFASLAGLVVLTLTASAAETIIMGSGGVVEYPDGTKVTCPNSGGICAIVNSATQHPVQAGDLVTIELQDGTGQVDRGYVIALLEFGIHWQPLEGGGE